MQSTRAGRPHLGLALGAALILLTGAARDGKAEAPALPAYKADLSQTSVSGLSSGAYMAGQFAVAYSGIVTGAGLVAGGPYYCAGYPGVAPYIPYLANAMSACMNPAESHVPAPAAGQSWEAARIFAQEGQIDATTNLKRQRVYLFSGTSDHTVTRAVVDQARLFYQLAGVAPEQVRYVDDVDAGHAIVTDRRTDQACALTGPPYVNDCHFVQAHDILRHIYPNLHPPAARLSGKILKFNQRSFVHSPFTSMGDTGYAYVPRACTSQTCRVHVAFHGCRQSASQVGDHFYAGAGYNELADTNRIIVLYPQVEASPVYPYNPRGCWDFWGYTSINPFLPDFYARSAPQMAAVRAMLDRLAE